MGVIINDLRKSIESLFDSDSSEKIAKSIVTVLEIDKLLSDLRNEIFAKECWLLCVVSIDYESIKMCCSMSKTNEIFSFVSLPLFRFSISSFSLSIVMLLAEPF